MMKLTTRRATVATALLLSAVALSACAGGSGGGGSGGEGGGGGGGGGGKIAFLMPDLASTRYEEQDSPLFRQRVQELCADCEVLYQNADSDPEKQQQQVESVIAQGAQVIVLDAVDTAAAASVVSSAQGQGIKVVTYDRPVPDARADFYISFDNEEIGRSIAQSLLDKLGADGIDGGVLVVGGSPTDNAAGLIKDGILAAVEPSSFPLLAEFDTPGWDPQEAQNWVSGQITQFGPEIAGIVAANDGTGGGAIAALKAAGADPLPLVTGNDAEIAAIQRIIDGSQYNTISKPIEIVASAAAETAVALLQGETVEQEAEVFGTPARLFIPTVVTTDNIKEVIFDAGIYTAEQVCTPEYAAACETLGIN